VEDAPKTNLAQHTEFETKYRAAQTDLTKFKRIVEEKFGPLTLYCEGPDDYFTMPDGSRFKRFRHATYPLTGTRKEVTTKVKPSGAKNNNIRTEKNLRVTDNDDALIKETIIDDGFEYDFSIWKSCHIYKLSDATLVFYTVVDTTPGSKYNEDHFIEIEVDEDIINTLTEGEAWEIVKKYEDALIDVGIHAQKRIRKSLYEMYTRKGK
jgi:adenylate cyclase class IV